MNNAKALSPRASTRDLLSLFLFTGQFGKVNEEISRKESVIKQEMSLTDAKKQGAMALFGEKYGDTVRTVKVSNFSFELCGGTHIDNTVEARCFKIMSESGIAAGIRRIEAITGDSLIKYYDEEMNKLNVLSLLLKTNQNDVVNKLQNLIDENKNLKTEIESLKKKSSMDVASNIEIENINGLNVVIKSFDCVSVNELKDIIDSVKDKTKDYAIIGIGKCSGQVPIVVAFSDLAVKKGLHAGEILKNVAEVLGGKGGGRDNFAQGQGKDSAKIEEAIKLAKTLINN